MEELEAVIEQNLINQLCSNESQWTYRPDLKNEEQLWDNFRYILEQNNKAILDDTPLTDGEFKKIKNDVVHNSFYDAAEWLVGENGKVLVHVQRGNDTLHLVVMNNEHIAGGSSVYEVINQFNAYGDEYADDQDRRFDVTLLINGLPMIHIELKNRAHSYFEGFNQIQKYIAEGKFHGIYSNVQMFVVSNAVDTKYFAPARDYELNKKFLTGWIDENNKPVNDYLSFAKDVLKIPTAHEMVSKYTVLDTDKRRILLLRPYQIHAIEAMREASKKGQSGFIWHTTGSGKTMTSYKSARNLLADIPSIDKTIFLIDRKALDEQTTEAFQSYANNDIIDVDDTDNVDELKKKLADGKRQMIVTTRQKLQILVSKRLKKEDKNYEKIHKLRIAFVVDECHRAVTPKTKRELQAFFRNSLWYGFTGTPIFEENKYDIKGDLPQTTEQMYGPVLHSYTIKEAIHDDAVLGFMVENLGSNLKTVDDSVYRSESHMRSVLDILLNHSASKFGMQNGRGRTYSAILTVSSIAMAQKYYSLLKKVVDGNDSLKISDEIHKKLSDFPKFAITYSLTENEDNSHVNQTEMKESLRDYNEMFGTAYQIDQIEAYNSNLNERLARKEKKYFDRSQQLDLVIVVDRLLTGFDSPCTSTLFIDRAPMSPQGLIQAFSRTNRLFDSNKQYGQIVTFQYPKEFKEAIDNALMLYSRGGDGKPVSEDWNTVKSSLNVSIKAIHGLSPTPSDALNLTKKQQKAFVELFRDLDTSFAHLKCFTNYDDSALEDTGFTQTEYENYAAAYHNIIQLIKPDPTQPDDDDKEDELVFDDYELHAYSKLVIDYEYIVSLLQGVVDSLSEIDNNLFADDEFAKKIGEIRKLVDDFAKGNPKLGELLYAILEDIEKDKEKYIGCDISSILFNMRHNAIEIEAKKFADKWFIDFNEVMFEILHYRYGNMSNENNFKDKADYSTYKKSVEYPLSKLKYRRELIQDFKENLMNDIGPLL